MPGQEANLGWAGLSHETINGWSCVLTTVHSFTYAENRNRAVGFRYPHEICDDGLSQFDLCLNNCGMVHLVIFPECVWSQRETYGMGKLVNALIEMETALQPWTTINRQIKHDDWYSETIWQYYYWFSSNEDAVLARMLL